MCLLVFNLTGSSFNWVCKPSMAAMGPLCHLLCWLQIWYRDQRRELSFMYNPKFRDVVLRTCGCLQFTWRSISSSSITYGVYRWAKGKLRNSWKAAPVPHPHVSLNFRFLFVWLVVVVTKYPRQQVTGIKIGFDSWLQSSHARALWVLGLGQECQREKKTHLPQVAKKLRRDTGHGQVTPS